MKNNKCNKSTFVDGNGLRDVDIWTLREIWRRLVGLTSKSDASRTIWRPFSFFRSLYGVFTNRDGTLIFGFSRKNAAQKWLKCANLRGSGRFHEQILDYPFFDRIVFLSTIFCLSTVRDIPGHSKYEVWRSPAPLPGQHQVLHHPAHLISSPKSLPSKNDV